MGSGRRALARWYNTRKRRFPRVIPFAVIFVATVALGLTDLTVGLGFGVVLGISTYKEWNRRRRRHPREQTGLLGFVFIVSVCIFYVLDTLYVIDEIAANAVIVAAGVVGWVFGYGTWALTAREHYTGGYTR